MRFSWCKIHGRYPINDLKSICDKPCFSGRHEYLEAISDVRSEYVSKNFWSLEPLLFNLTYYFGFHFILGRKYDVLISENYQKRWSEYFKAKLDAGDW